MSRLPIDLTLFSLQPVQACELAQLRELSIRTFTDAFAEANTQKDMERYVAEAFSEEQLKAEIQDAQATIYRLTSGDDDTLGCCKLRYGPLTAVKTNGNALEICRLYVSHDYQGLGRWMLEQIRKKALKEKLDFVWLGAWSQNPGAIRLYERQGFQKIGSYTFILGEDPQTDFIMQLKLS